MKESINTRKRNGRNVFTYHYDEKLDIKAGYLFRCLRLVSTRKNVLRICMATLIFILFLKFCAWWFTTDDFVEPLGAYDSTFCRPKDLIGHITVSALNASEFNDDLNIDPKYSSKMPNSRYDPREFEDCVIPNGQKLAIIIPFRDDGSNVRTNQLKVLLHYMIPILIRQNVMFQFFVVTQTQNSIFNRGKLMNIGFAEARKLNEFDCYFFHDVDLIIENDEAIYHCRTNPLHYSGYINKWNYTLPSNWIPYGGVTAFKPEAFQAINGYSNEYWGWGGEDDDLYKRMIQKYNLKRPDRGELYRYSMIEHEHESNNFIPKEHEVNRQLYYNWRYRAATDGLNSLNYNLVSIEEYKFYVNITADPLYDDRTPMDLLMPSFFDKISFFVGRFMTSLSSMFIKGDDRYADRNWYKTDLDKIVGT